MRLIFDPVKDFADDHCAQTARTQLGGIAVMEFRGINWRSLIDDGDRQVGWRQVRANYQWSRLPSIGMSQNVRGRFVASEHDLTARDIIEARKGRPELNELPFLRKFIERAENLQRRGRALATPIQQKQRSVIVLLLGIDKLFPFGDKPLQRANR